MGEGGIKNGQKNSDVFYGRPQTIFAELVKNRKYIGMSVHSIDNAEFIINSADFPA